MFDPRKFYEKAILNYPSGHTTHERNIDIVGQAHAIGRADERAAMASPVADETLVAVAREAGHLLRSLGEYVRQSMQTNPEWQAGVFSLEAALRAATRRGALPPEAIVTNFEAAAHPPAERATHERCEHPCMFCRQDPDTVFPCARPMGHPEGFGCACAAHLVAGAPTWGPPEPSEVERLAWLAFHGEEHPGFPRGRTGPLCPACKAWTMFRNGNRYCCFGCGSVSPPPAPGVAQTPVDELGAARERRDGTPISLATSADASGVTLDVDLGKPPSKR